VGRIFGIDCGVADAWEYFRRHQNEAGQYDQQRQDVHSGQSRAPRRDGDPQTADDDHDLDGEITDESRAA